MSVFVLLVSLALMVQHGSSYPNEAPLSACGTMIPQHRWDPLTTDPPFVIQFTETDYAANQLIEVAIKSKPGSGIDFKGFLLQAQTANGTTVGSFSVVTRRLTKTQCIGNTALTHTSARPKDDIRGKWKAPSTLQGPIVFKATVVERFSRFWTGVKSAPLPPKSS